LAAANMFFAVRTTTNDPMTLAAAFSREVHAVDPDVAAGQLRSLDGYLSDAVAPRRFNLFLLSIFSVSAFLLAITGIYAVTSYGVCQRGRELGIRMALGARPLDILRLVVADGARSVLCGILFGVPLAAVAMRALSALLFGVTSHDAAAFAQ